MNPISQRRGVTLAEVLVGIAIIAVVGAAVVPTIRGRLTVGAGQALANELTSLSTGINNYKVNVGRYPKRLDYLTQLPTSPTDVCGASLSTFQINSWRGPYVTRVIPAPGTFPNLQYYVVNGDTITTTLTRSPGNSQDSTTQNYIPITINNLDSARASSVKMVIDGQALSSSTGAISWSPTAGTSYGTLTYQVPVWGC